MGYFIDLKQISIDRYKTILKSANLIPSWLILKDDIDENLDRIKKRNIQNLQELKDALKTKDNALLFSKQSDLPEDYIMVLRRVINGYHPKPNKIKDFPNVSEITAKKLEKAGIKNTVQLFDSILTPKSREALSKQTGIDQDEILKLTKLTDVSRIRWVNYTFARVLYEAGYDTVAKMAKADHTELYETVKQLNTEREFYKAHIGLKDMQLLVQLAKELSLDVVYEEYGNKV